MTHAIDASSMKWRMNKMAIKPNINKMDILHNRIEHAIKDKTNQLSEDIKNVNVALSLISNATIKRILDRFSECEKQITKSCKMTIEKFESIMNGGSKLQNYKGKDTAILGLLIIRKYLPQAGITGAEHDIIYSCSAEDLVDAGITTKDATELINMNWMIDTIGGNHLAHFV